MPGDNNNQSRSVRCVELALSWERWAGRWGGGVVTGSAVGGVDRVFDVGGDVGGAVDKRNGQR